MRLDQRYMPDLQLMMQAMVDTDSRLSITPSQPVPHGARRILHIWRAVC